MRVFKIFSLCILLCQAHGVRAQMHFQWIADVSSNQFPSVEFPVEEIETDAEGNSFLFGHFTGTATYRTMGGLDTLYSIGAKDQFLSKLDKNGQLVWIHQFEGVESNLHISAILADQSGSVYCAATVSDTIDIDPSAGTTYIYPTGTNYPNTPYGEPLIIKFDSNGNLLDHLHIPTNGSDKALLDCFAINDIGELIIGMRFYGSIDFDPDTGSMVLTSNGLTADLVLLKTDFNLNSVWVRHFETSNVSLNNNHQHAGFHALTFDQFGNIYGTGKFVELDFNPDTSEYILSSVVNSDGFAMSLSGDGEFRYAGQIQNDVSLFSGKSNAVDSEKNLYSVGHFRYIADFDPDTIDSFVIETNTTTYQARNAFIVKYDSSGGLDWVRTLPSDCSTWAWAVDIDSSDNPVITGLFNGTCVDCDPDTTEFNICTPNGCSSYPSIYVWKLSSNGDFISALGFPSAGLTDVGTDVSIDADQNIFISGYFGNTIDFDPGLDSHKVTTQHYLYQNTFVLKLGPCKRAITASLPSELFMCAGEQTEVVFDSLDQLNDAEYWAVYIDSCSGTPIDTFTTGNFYAQFDSSTTIFVRGEGGCHQYPSCHQIQIEVFEEYEVWDTLAICLGDSFLAFNGTVGFIVEKDTSLALGYQTNTGCDSLVHLYLSSQSVFENNDTVRVCIGDSVQFHDGSSVSEVFEDFTHVSYLTTASGCDSLIHTRVLSIEHHLDSATVSVCKGDSFMYPDGSTVYNIKSNENHTSHLLSKHGCDSVVFISLHVMDLNAFVVQEFDSLISDTKADSYQWVDCENNYAHLIGENDSVFSPTNNGRYAVVISNDGCSDTSSCYEFNNLSISSYSAKNIFQFYPNPTNGHLTIRPLAPTQPIHLQLYSAHGQIVGTYAITDGLPLEIEIIGSSGVYFLKSQVLNDIHVHRIVLNR